MKKPSEVPSQPPPSPIGYDPSFDYRVEQEFRLAADLRLVLGAPDTTRFNPGVMVDIRVPQNLYAANEKWVSHMNFLLSKSKARALASAILAVASEQ